MKRTILAIAMTTVFGASSAFAVTLDSEEQKLSYSFGAMMAKQMQPSFAKLDVEAFSAAIKDIYSGADSQLSEEVIEASLKKFQDAQVAIQQVAAAEAAAQAKIAAEKSAAENQEKGSKYLAENAKRDGVTTTKSGLQIEITTPGKGAMPTAEDTVIVHYTGTSIDGTVFDSSVKRGKPATFPLKGVIPGWTEGLQLIKEGGKAKLYIPSELAYGLQGAGGSIGPGETLIFDVELIEIVKKEEAAK
ncbi:MAG: FKBP-type peptidyl-prolyl cis-trans isomerase [Oceanospirillaceae bacterium]